jgi:hypothetical protein
LNYFHQSPKDPKGANAWRVIPFFTIIAQNGINRVVKTLFSHSDAVFIVQLSELEVMRGNSFHARNLEEASLMTLDEWNTSLHNELDTLWLL